MPNKQHYLDLHENRIKDLVKNKEDIQRHLKIETNYDNNNIPEYTFKLASGYEDFDLHYLVREYILCTKIEGYLNNYNRLNVIYMPRITTMIHIIYLLGWLYILIKNYLIFF